MNDDIDFIRQPEIEEIVTDDGFAIAVVNLGGLFSFGVPADDLVNPIIWIHEFVEATIILIFMEINRDLLGNLRFDEMFDPQQEISLYVRIDVKKNLDLEVFGRSVMFSHILASLTTCCGIEGKLIGSEEMWKWLKSFRPLQELIKEAVGNFTEVDIIG